ncbi:hypothetical protein TNCV_3536521 [Trichonephila clavipes]|uniref:Uncharacterized protein n=1 Tax=Trichonephila clavipes TaxID=2585209 RepID=A0A8X6VWH4_TRICX|nr:hypothetical protein TNCV_3536521 [Trichonephila clavipes]
MRRPPYPSRELVAGEFERLKTSRIADVEIKVLTWRGVEVRRLRCQLRLLTGIPNYETLVYKFSQSANHRSAS